MGGEGQGEEYEEGVEGRWKDPQKKEEEEGRVPAALSMDLPWPRKRGGAPAMGSAPVVAPPMATMVMVTVAARHHSSSSPPSRGSL